MKKSIRGSIKISNQNDKQDIINDINKYTLWKLQAEEFDGELIFEVWVDNEQDENSLFSDIKYHVNRMRGSVSRHDCTHDEDVMSPCVISETYTVE